jgi:hypothetical protein
MPTRRLVLNLKGGLGNQLFGIYAAMALESEFKVNCAIHTYGIDLNHKSGNTDATAFQYGRGLNLVEGRSLSQRLLNNRHIQKISENIKFDSTVLSQVRYFEKNDWGKTLVDLGDILDSEPRTVHLDGFFQDFSYFNKVNEFLPNFTLAEPSNWLASQKELAATLRPIIIHIRLGDYSENGMQILTKDYFNEALLEMCRLVESDDVWVFSDSPTQAREFLDIPTSKRVRFLANDQKSTETLMLMREGSGLICSNSTFSYWAGRTSTHARPVIFPRKFSPNPDLQIRNVPKEWISLTN